MELEEGEFEIPEEVVNLHQELYDKDCKDSKENDLDSVDGFRKFVSKTLKNLSCVSREGDKRDSGEGSSSFEPPISVASKDNFNENQTVPTNENNQNGVDSDVYDFQNMKRGLAVIINNEDFRLAKDFGDRPGSSYDCASLCHTFKKLGFDILRVSNVSAFKMIYTLQKAQRDYDHINADCFVCCILSHGDEAFGDTERSSAPNVKVRKDVIYGVHGRPIYTKDVIDSFNDEHCPGLKNKPRLFFFQACRGSKLDVGHQVKVLVPKYTPGIKPAKPPAGKTFTDGANSSNSDQPWNTPTSSSVDPPKFHIDHVDAKPDDHDALPAGAQPPVKFYVISPPTLYEHSLVMYATPPGFYAWRRKNGAWFVQSLCKVLNSSNMAETPLLKALVRASGVVARDYQSENRANPSMHHKKVIPVIESMLTKDIYFPPKYVF